jgi:hypothetical protein
MKKFFSYAFKISLSLLLLVITNGLFSVPVFTQAPNVETITISTYYPSPVGVFRELRAQRGAIGNTYYDASQYCWPPNVCTNQIGANTGLVVEGDAGIGTTNPATTLNVAGRFDPASPPGLASGGIIRLSNNGTDAYPQNRAIQMRIGANVDLESLYVPLVINNGSCYVSGSFNPADCQDIHIIPNHPTVGQFNPARVGIGSSNPGAKLDVVGTIRSSAANDYSRSVDLWANGNNGNYGGHMAILRMGGGASSDNDEIWIGPGGTIRNGFAGHVQIVGHNLHLMTSDDTNAVPTARDGMVEVTGGMNIHSNDSPVILPRLSADPPAAKSVNGAIYYNTATKKFRGHVNGAWKDF